MTVVDLAMVFAGERLHPNRRDGAACTFDSRRPHRLFQPYLLHGHDRADAGSARRAGGRDNRSIPFENLDPVMGVPWTT